MGRFVEWLRQEMPPSHFKRVSGSLLEQLYATAFEFTAIGAAVAEERGN